GGSDGDNMTAVAVNAAGEQFVSGISNSIDFPTTPGVYDDWAQNIDATVTKMNAAGTAIIWSTYLGGAADDVIRNLVVDGNGRPLLAGYSASWDYPTVNAYDPVGKGADSTVYPGQEYDVVLSKLSADGASLVFSTYFASSGPDQALGLAYDASGRIYISGSSYANDLPTTSGYQNRYAGGDSDGFVASFTGDGQTLRFCTYLGGTDVDNMGEVSVDPGSGRVAVTGTSESTNYPTKYAFQRAISGSQGDGVISILDPAGKKLLYSTYVGGSLGLEEIIASGFDSTGRLIAWGNSGASDLTVDRTFGTPGSNDGVLVAITPTYTKDYVVRFGGLQALFGFAIQADDKITVGGIDNGSDIPATNGAFQYVNADTNDAFVLRVNKTATQINYLSRIGGLGSDTAFDGNYDANGVWHIAGSTDAPDFPTTSTGYDRVLNILDGFITQIDFSTAKVSIDPVSFTYGDATASLTLRIPTPVANSTNINLIGGGGILQLPNTATIVAGNTSVTISVPLSYTTTDAGKLVRFT
ncbi:MAG TPA: hypothetical protein VK968_15255, partial [Roseimicrobium sp.]|nr:hypothetical protein [Roseimicrobium sp.]